MERPITSYILNYNTPDQKKKGPHSYLIIFSFYLKSLAKASGSIWGLFLELSAGLLRLSFMLKKKLKTHFFFSFMLQV